MGPRSEDRGDVACNSSRSRWASTLQWVHGPRTVVMTKRDRSVCTFFPASMGPRSEDRGDVGPARSPRSRAEASMGPRSEDRGDGKVSTVRGGTVEPLQWVHGPRTVVMVNREYLYAEVMELLQWVHGPRTVVMWRRPGKQTLRGSPGFNGSTVRGPW